MMIRCLSLGIFGGGEVEIIGKLIVLGYGRVWRFPDPVVIYKNTYVLIDIY